MNERVKNRGKRKRAKEVGETDRYISVLLYRGTKNELKKERERDRQSAGERKTRNGGRKGERSVKKS